jgi:hypothetical protein
MGQGQQLDFVGDVVGWSLHSKSVRRAIASEFEYHDSLFKVRVLKRYGERNIAAIFSLSLTVNRKRARQRSARDPRKLWH